VLVSVLVGGRRGDAEERGVVGEVRELGIASAAAAISDRIGR
jgi:hypothetical protein